MAAECLLHLESLGGQKMDGLRSGKLQDTHKGWVAGWLGGWVCAVSPGNCLSSGDLPGWVTCGHRMSSAGQPCEREAGCTGDGKRGATGVGDLSRAGWKVGRRNEGHCLLVLGQWLCPGCGVSRAERTV